MNAVQLCCFPCHFEFLFFFCVTFITRSYNLNQNVVSHQFENGRMNGTQKSFIIIIVITICVEMNYIIWCKLYFVDLKYKNWKWNTHTHPEHKRYINK